MPANDGQQGVGVQNQSRSNITPSLSTQRLVELFSTASPDPVKFLNIVLEESITLLASDIFFEPTKENLKIRVRIDGVLYELGRIDGAIYNQISAKVKVLSSLDPTDKTRIQEGQFTKEFEGRAVNLRVEIAQTLEGELIVVRVHERGTIVMQLSELGFSNQAYDSYNKMLRGKSGLVLVCGPTGSGKTTTIYSTISKLAENQNNIMTIEDPVEFQLEGINQMQVHEKTGFNFAAGLKTILRLSPDVVFVGEIRDDETAKIAIESGLTGLLVLSTIHAQDSVSALFRLLDLGIEPYLLNSAVTGIVAQRLVRKNCEACKTPYQLDADRLTFFEKTMGRPPQKLVRGGGCGACSGLGYKGRTGLYEVLMIDSRLRDLIRRNPNEDVLRQELINVGFVNLLQDGLMKAEMGLTTVEEVLRNSFKIA